MRARFNAKQNAPEAVIKCSTKLTAVTIDVWDKVKRSLLPTPSRSHYTFNMRDVSKVFQGMCWCTRESLPKVEDLCKVWLHECGAVFKDRLVPVSRPNRKVS
jgi:dynein heavy chain